jgi:hypothetical protein
MSWAGILSYLPWWGRKFMSLGPSFIIFGILDNLLWISNEFTRLWVFSNLLNQNHLHLKTYLRFLIWIPRLESNSFKYQVWTVFGPLQFKLKFEMDSIWNNPKGITTMHCSLRLHQSPMPQRPTGPRPSKLAHSGSFQPAHGAWGAASACTMRSACGHHEQVQQAHAAQRGGGSSAIRSSPQPSSRLQLQVAALRPREGGRRKGPHRRGGRSGSN